MKFRKKIMKFPKKKPEEGGAVNKDPISPPQLELALYAPQFANYLQDFGDVKSELKEAKDPYLTPEEIRIIESDIEFYRTGKHNVGTVALPRDLLFELARLKDNGYGRVRRETHAIYIDGNHLGDYKVFLGPGPFDPRLPGFKIVDVKGVPYSVIGHVFDPDPIDKVYRRKDGVGIYLPRLGARLEFATANDWGYSSGPSLLIRRQDKATHIPFP